MENYWVLSVILWLTIIAGQVMAIIIMFGWRKKVTKQQKIFVGIALILMLISVFWLTSGN